jgi:hypothetical protein
MGNIYPVADSGNLGAWSPTPLWQQLADTSTLSYVQSANTTNFLSMGVRLAAFAFPGDNAGWFVGCECRVISGDFNSASVRVTLFQPGLGEIGAATTALNSLGGWTWCGFNLTPTQVNSITDFSQLEIDVTKLNSATSCGVACGYTYLAIPEGFPHLDMDTATGALLVVQAESGHYLTLDANGAMVRQSGTEATGALYLENGEVKVWP